MTGVRSAQILGSGHTFEAKKVTAHTPTAPKKTTPDARSGSLIDTIL